MMNRTLIAAAGLCVVTGATAATLDYFGPPPDGDPSALTGPIVSEELADALVDEIPVYEGAIEGGPTGTAADQGVTGFLSEGQLDDGGKYNVPTGGPPSPLYEADGTTQTFDERGIAFTQKMLRFEEFGTRPLPADETDDSCGTLLWGPKTGEWPYQDPDYAWRSAPDSLDLDALLGDNSVVPYPTVQSNTHCENPWKGVIAHYLDRLVRDNQGNLVVDPAFEPPAEGRPPGEGWAHQRWNEFKPVEYYKTAQAGARDNTGFRNPFQRHRYEVGEFGPGGLYYNTVGDEGVDKFETFNGTTEGIQIRFHPNMPIQSHKAVWTFDGTLPPKLLNARNGQSLIWRHYNALPIDVTANRGFGMHTITTHEHNGHTPAESDGYAGAFFFPGQFYDYRWPLALAGYDSINTDASDPRAAFPCEAGETLFVNDVPGGRVKECTNGTIQIRGDWRQTMSTHWFHDHMIDFTAPNVYKGNAAMMNYYSAIDRGNEAVDDGVNLRLPSGDALSWGNRDYDVNLVIAGKAWDREGQLWFNIFNKDGFLGDRMLVNWLYKPYFDVRARRYRFRLLNGSVSRYLKIALVQEVRGANTGRIPGRSSQGVSWNPVPFHLVANDGNIMEHAIRFDDGVLPVQAIAERYDIVVDFSAFQECKDDDGLPTQCKLYFVNVLEHKNGKIVEGSVDLGSVLRETYKAEIEFDENGRAVDWVDGDPVVGKFLEFRVHGCKDGMNPVPCKDNSMNPADYEPGNTRGPNGSTLTMIPLVFDRDDPTHMAKASAARKRTFEFGRSSGTDAAPWTVKTDGGSAYTADLRRLSAAPQLATGPTDATGFDAQGFSGDGTAEVWRMESGGGWSHPIHVHFEEGVVINWDGEAPAPWIRWARKDVFRIGGEEEAARDVDVFYNFREFAGSYVEHCHNTQHEDHAMLLRWDLERPGQVQIMPAPIPTWDGVEYVDTIALPTFRSGTETTASTTTDTTTDTTAGTTTDTTADTTAGTITDTTTNTTAGTTTDTTTDTTAGTTTDTTTDTTTEKPKPLKGKWWNK